jgi:hypothetical protein
MLLPLEVFHDWSSACCKTSIPYMQMVGCGQARTGQIDGGQDGGYPPRRAGASLTICQCHDYPSAIYYYVTPAAACSSPVSTQKAAPVRGGAVAGAAGAVAPVLAENYKGIGFRLSVYVPN